jgi:hypothetical protein
MREQDEALRDLNEAYVLDGLRWSARSSVARTMEDFDPDTGHDQGWLGYTFHKLLKDRLDRVFSCGRFAVPTLDESLEEPLTEPLPEDSVVGLDVLGTGLTQRELDSMPRIAPGVVSRADLNGSPGWRSGVWRWLLASFPYGGADRIPWPQKSPTKRRVAAQPDPDQLAFDPDVMGLPLLSAVLADLARVGGAGDTTTLVLGHALDPDSGRAELPLGRPRLNSGGGDAWHWRIDLLRDGPPSGGQLRLAGRASPDSPSSGDVADAPVRLRRPESGTEEASGDRW